MASAQTKVTPWPRGSNSETRRGLRRLSDQAKGVSALGVDPASGTQFRQKPDVLPPSRAGLYDQHDDWALVLFAAFRTGSPGSSRSSPRRRTAP